MITPFKSAHPTAPASAESVAHARAFLMEPSTEVEAKLLASMRVDLEKAGFEWDEGPFIEWGCVEHGVIHVALYGAQQWVELNPAACSPTWTAV